MPWFDQWGECKLPNALWKRLQVVVRIAKVIFEYAKKLRSLSWTKFEIFEFLLRQIWKMWSLIVEFEKLGILLQKIWGFYEGICLPWELNHVNHRNDCLPSRITCFHDHTTQGSPIKLENFTDGLGGWMEALPDRGWTPVPTWRHAWRSYI